MNPEFVLRFGTAVVYLVIISLAAGALLAALDAWLKGPRR